MKYLIFLAALLGFSCSSLGQDFSIISQVTKEKSIFPKINLGSPAKEIQPKKKVKSVGKTTKNFPQVPAKSAPSWDLLGSIKDAYNKPKMINHLLNHSNHRGKWNREYLETLSLGQLWYLHDQDHEKQSKPKVIKFEEPCPGGT